MRSALAISIALAACHSAPAPAAPAVDDEVRVAEANVAWFESKAAAVCACDDRACFTVINDEIGDWMPAHFGEARLDETQRQRMRTGSAQLLACVAALDEPPPINGAHEALTALRSTESRMCACADAACVKRVDEEMDQLLRRYADTKASEAQIKEAGEIVGHITECASRAVTP